MRRSLSRWNDLPFAGVVFPTLVGPLNSPPVAAVRATVAQIIDADPAGPFAASIARGRAYPREHVDADALARRLVVDTGAVPGLAQAQGAEVARVLADRLETEPMAVAGDLPFRITVGPDHARLVWNHVLGDSSLANAALIGVLLAVGGQPLPDALVRPSTPGLARALLPSAWQALKAQPRRHRHPKAKTIPGPPLPSAVAGVVHARYDSTVLRQVKVASRAQRVRRSSLLVALADLAVADTGLGSSSDVRTIVVDCRRYLPPGVTVRGNLSTGQSLAAPWHDAAGIEAVVTQTLADARPVLTLPVASLMSAVQRVYRPAQRRGRPQLARPHYSVVGLLPGAHQLPWSGDPHIVVGGMPERPDDLGFTIFEIGSSLQVSMTYDRTAFDADWAWSVLDRLTERLAAL